MTACTEHNVFKSKPVYQIVRNFAASIKFGETAQDGIGEFEIWRFECSASYMCMR